MPWRVRLQQPSDVAWYGETTLRGVIKPNALRVVEQVRMKQITETTAQRTAAYRFTAMGPDYRNIMAGTESQVESKDHSGEAPGL